MKVSLRQWSWGCVGIALLGLFFFLSLSLGSVPLSFSEVWATLTGGDARRVAEQIILNIRLPRAITAMFSGAALSLAGLQMQTIFRNPLADPFVLGVNSGASLGVAIIVLVLGGSATALLGDLGIAGNYTIVAAATAGSALVLGIILMLSIRVDLMTLLIIGLMVGYATSAFVTVLMFFSLPEQLQSYFAWGYGSFGSITWGQMWAFIPALAVGIGMSLISSKAMNAFLLGENYARSMGVPIFFWRTWVLLSASLLTGAVTGFCGPIGFVGIAVPHLCRSLLQTSDHRVLYPAVLLFGALICLFADFIAQVPGSRLVLPLNAITALLGSPFVIAILIQKRGLRQAFGG